MEHGDLTEIDASENVHAVVFSIDGKYLLGINDEGVRAWWVEDGRHMATMRAKEARCLAISRDGSWIAAGTGLGDVFVWAVGDAGRTYRQVFCNRSGSDTINGVDFSPDATRLVSASNGCTASVWDIPTRERVLLLPHSAAVTAVKYSRQGDRIVTATRSVVRVYDNINHSFLLDIQVTVTPLFNTGVLWFGRHLLVLSGSTIKRIKASTGKTVSEWLVPDSTRCSCIALSRHSGFIACAAKRIVSFWDTATHEHLGSIRYPKDIHSIAVSQDDCLLAIGGEDENVLISSLTRIDQNSVGAPGQVSAHQQALQNKQPSALRSGNDDELPDSAPRQGGQNPPRAAPSPLHLPFRAPDLQLDNAVLNLWKQGRLTEAEALLTMAITTSRGPNHHILTGRALVRNHLQEWDAALVDAEKAIEIQPSVIGYIAKSIVLVGKGERHESYHTCDVAFERFRSSHGRFLLLIQAMIMSMARDHRDAMSRMDDMIVASPSDLVCYMVQAYMHLLIGNSHMETGDYESAIASFKRARAQVRHRTNQSLSTISLISGWKFDNLSTMIRQSLCDALYVAGSIHEAVGCFHEMTSESGWKIKMDDEHLEWTLDFGQRSSKKLVDLGDTAVGSQQYKEAIPHYTVALSLNSYSLHDILLKRGKAYIAGRLWNHAVEDANRVIALDPASPWGYEMKHAALHQAGNYGGAISAFERMLSKIAASPDLDIPHWYISPDTIRETIRKVVQRTICHSPRILINTTTGRLHDKTEQVSAFEALPVFDELISSMTTRIDHPRIKREVRQYFRYVMLSHRWEDHEPLFHQVTQTTVYDLDHSSTHDKLQTFCKIVRDAGFAWAWSDTCCINKSDHFVLQEALVAMFKWYQGSAMTIVFLRGVHSSSQPGALVRSIWNTRAWTLQEYIAAKVILFYTENWTLYLDLRLPNHKESQDVISEMEEVTGIPAQHLMALRPGLTSIREKLRLASTRKTTLVEDAAYSLLGIFSVAGIPAIYGEREGSLGRLLSHVLAGSGDSSILAWTGEPGGFNSCLPAHITVFDGPASSHLPSPISDTEIEIIIDALPTPSFDLDLALRLSDRLSELPAPWFAANRMKLPCIAFQLPPISHSQTRSGRVFRVNTPVFGPVEITTRHDLSRMTSLCLVHPWLDALLEQEHARDDAFVEDDIEAALSPNRDDDEIPDKEFDDDDERSGMEPESPLQPIPSPAPAYTDTVLMDRETRAQRLVARLRQPFGALLVALVSTGRRAKDYRRVAADSLITVQIREDVPLAMILDNVRTLDIL